MPSRPTSVILVVKNNVLVDTIDRFITQRIAGNGDRDQYYQVAINGLMMIVKVNFCGFLFYLFARSFLIIMYTIYNGEKIGYMIISFKKYIFSE